MERAVSSRAVSVDKRIGGGDCKSVVIAAGPALETQLGKRNGKLNVPVIGALCVCYRDLAPVYLLKVAGVVSRAYNGFVFNIAYIYERAEFARGSSRQVGKPDADVGGACLRIGNKGGSLVVFDAEIEILGACMELVVVCKRVVCGGGRRLPLTYRVAVNG